LSLKLNVLNTRQ